MSNGNRPPVYTMFASSMVSNTDIVTARLAKEPVGMSRRVLKITAPVGPSSAAGELARQSMTLVSGNTEPVCGWVDFVSKNAELRDYRTVKSAFEGRYRTGFDVTEPEYVGFCQKLLAVLKELDVKGIVTGDESNYAATDPAMGTAGAKTALVESYSSEPESSGLSLLPVILGALLAGVGLAVAVYFIMR